MKLKIGIKQQDAVTILTKIKTTKDQNSRMFFKRENKLASQPKRVEDFKNDSPNKPAKTIAKDSILIEKDKENIELKMKTETFHFKQKNPLNEQSHSAPNQNENII